MVRTRSAFRGLTLLRRHWLILLVGAAVLAFVIPLCRRGIVLSDEGYLLLQALDMREGKVLYRDMDAFVTPGIWILLAGVFSLLEPSVLSSRILALLGYLALTGVCYRIVAEQTSRAYGLATIAALAVFTVWAFPTWTFAFYSPFSVLFGLAALERLLAWRKTRRGRDLIWTGALLGLSISFKQNYGVLALLGTLVALLTIRFEARGPLGAALRGMFSDLTRVSAGLVVIGFPLISYFVYKGAFTALFDSLVLHPFEFMGKHDIPYLGLAELWKPDVLSGLERWTYGAIPLYRTFPPFLWVATTRVFERLHVLLYWLPPLVFTLGLAAVLGPLRRRGPLDASLVVVLAVCGSIFLGVFPRADFNHLGNVYQPVIVAAAIVTQRLRQLLPAPRSAWMHVLAALGCLILAVYAVVAGYWYQALLTGWNTKLERPRGGVLLAPFEAARIEVQVRFIEAQTRDGEALLTVPDLAMLNFLADRPVPSRYYNLYEHHISHDQGAGVVKGAEANHVRLAVTRYENFFSDRAGLRDYAPELTNYLHTHFSTILTMVNRESIFLKRRKVALPEHKRMSVLGDCDLTGKDSNKRVVRDHLLFSSLYHEFSADVIEETLESRCTILLPENAELALQIGYRHPAAVSRGSSLAVEVLVISKEVTELLLQESFRVTRRQGWGYAPFAEHRRDLSHLAGEEVSLVFRSVFSGPVQPHPLSPRGFTTFWQDPRIETSGSLVSDVRVSQE